MSAAVRVPQKEELVLDWIVVTLQRKFSSNKELTEVDKLWNLMLTIMESPDFEEHFLASHPNPLEVMASVVDHLCTCDCQEDRNAPEQWLRSLIRQFRHVRSAMLKKSGDELNHFIAKCLSNKVIVVDVLWLCNLSIQQQNTSSISFVEVLLPHLLVVKDDQIDRLIGAGLFSKEKSVSWTAFLKSLFITDDKTDSKPKSFEFLDSVLAKMKVLSPKDALNATTNLLSAGLKSKSLNDMSKGLFFCMSCDILQLYPQSSEDTVRISMLASTLLPKVSATLEDRLECLTSMIQSLVASKLDLNTILSSSDGSPSLQRFLQHLIKNQLLQDDLANLDKVCLMSVQLANYSPMVIEPLIGTLAVAIMTSG